MIIIIVKIMKVRIVLTTSASKGCPLVLLNY